MFSSLNVKDLVGIAVFSTLMILVQLVSGAVTTVSYFVNMVMSNGFSCFVNAHIFLLMAARVGRKGPFMACMILQSLVFVLLGYWFVAVYLVAVGLIGEALFMRGPGAGQSLGRLTALWTFYSFLVIGVSLLPIHFTWAAYVRAAEAGGFSAEHNAAYFGYYTNPVWVAVIAAFTTLCGFLGALSGRRLLRRHFLRSGLIGEMRGLRP